MKTTTILGASLLLAAFGVGTAPARAQEPTQKLSLDYTVSIDDPSGNQRLEEEQKVIRTADGGFVAVYTEGNPQNIYIGKVVKLDAAGQPQWQRDIMPGKLTYCNTLCEDAGGNIYVGGTYQDDFETHPYVSALASDGTPLFEKKMEHGSYNPAGTGMKRLLPYAGGIVAVSYVKASYLSSTAYYSVLSPAGAETLSGSVALNGTPQDATVSAGILSIMCPSQLAGIDLAGGQAIETLEGSSNQYLKEAPDGFYLLTGAGAEGVLKKYTVADGKYSEAWSCSVALTDNFINGYIFPGRQDDVYVVIKQFNDYKPVVMCDISAQGQLLKSGTPSFKSKEVGGGYFYNLGFDSEGNIVLAGHATDYLVYMAKLTPDFQYLDAKEYLIGSPAQGFTFSYMRPDQAIAFDNKMVAASFIRRLDENDGYFPYVAQWDLDGDMDIAWKQIYEPGATPNAAVRAVAGAADGGSYAAVRTRTAMSLRHFDANGRKVWDAPVTAQYEYMGTPEIQRLATLSDGTVIGLGSVAETPGQ